MPSGEAKRRENPSANIWLSSDALHCRFRDHLDNMLLDQLVCGVRDLRLQKRLLAKANLNLKQAIEEA
ncbi:hypothetical protein E2320_001502 [Naja naja]|nr:hypothetical protein E2320_001502 [Naja naja]